MYDAMYKGRFVWNRLKALANQKKHPEMTFEKGSEAYDDPLAIEEYDDENSIGEDRYNRTGIVGDEYITVTFTVRGHLVRIISVRGSDREEEDAYEEHARRCFGIG